MILRYFSMFSGIGGFEYGINKATDNSWECVGYSEIDKYAIKTYEKHFPTHKNYGDCKTIKPEDLPDFDMLCGGFPCQSFSIAGKRKGFQDTRGTMFAEICKIARIKRPRLLFLENVRGLLSADDGRCFATILTSLDELGYSCEWQVLNSKHFGVPQNRERVFIIGHLRGISFKQVFPIRQGSCKTDTTQKQVSATTNAGYYKIGRDQQYMISHSPRTGDSKKGGTGLLVSEEYCFTPDSTPHILFGRTQSKEVREYDNMCPCLNNSGTMNYNVKKDKVRKLTPLECERLQGFPDNWTIGSDTQRYKQCGNAVTVNVISFIIENIWKTLNTT